MNDVKKQQSVLQAVGNLLHALNELDEASGSSFCGASAQKIKTAAGELVQKVVSGKKEAPLEPPASEWT